MDRSDLIRAAFRGLAEGLLSEAIEKKPTVERSQRRRAPRKHTTRQAPLPFDYQPYVGTHDEAAPSVQELDNLFGEEALAGLRRQMEMQKQAAEVNPAPPKPPDNPVTAWNSVPDL